MRNRSNESGMILIVVLWVLVILTSLAISLGRNTSMELALAKNSIAKVKTKYIAWAGLTYAVDLIDRDSNDPQSSKNDTLAYCAIPIDDNKTNIDLFEKQFVGEGSFTVSYNLSSINDQGQAVFGLQDEQSRININAITVQNMGIIVSLFELLGYDTDIAQTIAYSLVDWKDADLLPSDENYGAEDEYYEGLSKPYKSKNRPFDSVEELLLVRGVTEDIYNDMAEHITIFPKQGTALKVNFNTASDVVLKAIARSQVNVIPEDADRLMDKIVTFRSGDDNIQGTADDQSIQINEMSLSASETGMFLTMNQYNAVRAEYLRVNIQAVDDMNRAKTNLTAIVTRKDLLPIFWRRL